MGMIENTREKVCAYSNFGPKFLNSIYFLFVDGPKLGAYAHTHRETYIRFIISFLFKIIVPAQNIKYIREVKELGRDNKF
jgi:hypothetical protein